MDLSQIKQILGQSDILHSLGKSELESFAKMGKAVEFKKGEPLVNEDQQGDDVFVILSGRVDIELTLPDTGKSQVIATLKNGEVLGELMLLGRGRRSATARAKDLVEAFCWSKNDLLELFQKNHRLGYVVMTNLAKILAQRLTTTNMELRNVMNKVVGFVDEV